MKNFRGWDWMYLTFMLYNTGMAVWNLLAANYGLVIFDIFCVAVVLVSWVFFRKYRKRNEA